LGEDYKTEPQRIMEYLPLLSTNVRR